MSMRSYPISMSGILLSYKELNISEFAKRYAEELALDNITDEEEIKEAVYEFLEEEELDVPCGGHISGKSHLSDDIEGDFYSLLTGDEKNISIYENWLIFDLPRYPSLFKAAYKDKADLLQQMKTIYGAFVKDPDSFDWEGRLVRLEAVIFG